MRPHSLANGNGTAPAIRNGRPQSGNLDRPMLESWLRDARNQFRFQVPKSRNSGRSLNPLNAVQCSVTVAIRRRELLSELFSAMLDELMTGQIRVNKLTFAKDVERVG